MRDLFGMTDGEMKSKKMLELRKLATEAGLKGQWNLRKKKDFINFFPRSRERKPELTHFMFLVMALEKKIKNYSCLTKRELQEALGLDISDDEDIRSQPYILLSEGDHEILAWAQNTQRSDRFSGCLFKQTCQGDERWRWFQYQWSWLRNFKTIKLLSLEEAEWQMLLWWDLKFKKIIFFSLSKMENLERPELITEAKRLGLRGYSRLRKLDLLELIKGSSNKVRSILNQKFPDIEKARSDRDGNGRQGERFCQGIHTFNSFPPICRNWICNHIERFLKAIPDQRCRSLQSWKVHGEGKTWILEVDGKKIVRRRSNRSIQIKEARFSTDVDENHEATDEDEVFSMFVKKIQELIKNFNKIGSNWRFQSITSLDMCLAEFKLLGGSSYIKLFLSAEKAVINIKNEEDEECFRWYILRHLTPQVEKNPQGISDLRDKVEKISQELNSSWIWKISVDLKDEIKGFL